MQNVDLIVLGAGIVGAATARELKKQFPSLNICLLEKETAAALHQTGRNSGVIHAGVYYPPGSLKAKFCQQGLVDTINFCQCNSINYEQCGKLIVATSELEQQRLQDLHERCLQNDLSPQLLSQKQLQEMSPNIVGKEAVFIKQTGIVDYQQVTHALLDEFVALGGKVRYGFCFNEVEQSNGKVCLLSDVDKVSAKYVVNCAGVMSDRVAKSFDMTLDFRIIPFKGEYFVLPSKYNNLIDQLIYPVPDPSLPFLGVHLTKMIDGRVSVGPNAVLAGAREGYGKYDVNIFDLFETFGFAGFWQMIKQHKRSVWDELTQSLFKTKYLTSVQKYCPQIQLSELLPYRSGIRAQAVDNNGTLIHDFKFLASDTSLHVCNAPSPAATSALPIAREIVNNVKLNLTSL